VGSPAAQRGPFAEGSPSDPSLHRWTSLRVGGPAGYLVSPADAEDVVRTIQSACDVGNEWVGLGAGTNTLFLDEGYPGVVIRSGRLLGVTIRGRRLTAAAGEPLAHAVRLACEAGLSGLEWAAGIPGTVGGAVIMNAGSAGGEVTEVLLEATSASSKGLRRRPSEELSLGYRESAFHSGRLREFVTEATFELVPGSSERSLAKVRSLLAERTRKYPTGATAGSTFRNPRGGPTAGELLDRAGCKGMRVGAAHVAERHANFILNDSERNADDILRLIDAMKRRVFEAFGIELVEEIDIYPKRGTTRSLGASSAP